jgi:hypothetical protein
MPCSAIHVYAPIPVGGEVCVEDGVDRALQLEAEADAVDVAAGHIRVVVLQNHRGA